MNASSANKEAELEIKTAIIWLISASLTDQTNFLFPLHLFD